jgi:glyoxylase-like metal-dependent hydrolase (beta-lactamase superfamily II)
MADSIVRLDLGMVNVYLVANEDGFFLIDTGFGTHRARVDALLRGAGCRANDLKLIVVTHGDADHAANAAYLRTCYGAKIAMHRTEAPAVERGNMFLSRGTLSFSHRLMKPVMSLFRLRKRDRFAPDVLLEDGDRLDAYGWNAVALHVPGHTVGSLAILTDDGHLFSGDFLENRRGPSIATFVDDRVALMESFRRVEQLPIRTVHPGHGAPFSLNEL